MASARIPTYVYHAMKAEKKLPAEGPAGAPRQCQSKPRGSRLALVRSLMATFVIMTPGMVLGGDGQTLQPPDGGSPVTNADPSSPALLAAEGRRQPSYQVFAFRCTSPSITVVNETTLEIGGKQKIDVSRLNQLDRAEKETLAGQFDVPVSVVDNLQKSCSKQTPADAAEVAGKLRVMVIDYKYLLERWTQYHPPTGQEKVKTDALLALQGGNVDKAWEMFAALPKPRPPTGFHVAG